MRRRGHPQKVDRASPFRARFVALGLAAAALLDIDRVVALIVGHVRAGGSFRDVSFVRLGALCCSEVVALLVVGRVAVAAALLVVGRVTLGRRFFGGGGAFRRRCRSAFLKRSRENRPFSSYASSNAKT